MPKIQSTASSRQISLRLILIVPFLVQIFVAVGLVGWFSWRSGQQAVNKLVANLGDEITARVHQKLTDHLEIAETVVQLNIDAVQLGMLDLEQHPEATAYLFQQLLRFPQLTGITIATETPNYVGIIKASDGTPVLTLWNRSDTGVIDYFLDEQGQIVDISKIDQDYDHRQRPWYVNPTKVGVAQWQAPYLTVNPVGLTISVDQPFYNQEGDLLGVSDAELSLTSISEFLATVRVGKTGQIFIMERTGNLVATSTGQQPYTRHGGTVQYERLNANQSGDPLIEATVQFLEQQFGDLNQVNQSEQFNVTLAGKQQFLQVVPFRLTGGVEWLVVIAVPEADFMTEIQHNRLMTVALCSVALTIASGLGVLTTRWLIHPVETLAVAANGLSQGQWQQLVTPPRIRELARLAQAFNRMAYKLQSSFQALEYSADHDDLTGLLNRSGLQKALQVAIDQRTDGLFTAFFLDIDNFKLVNDSFGHWVGDQLLVAIALRLRQTLENLRAVPPQVQITVARFGGDEFFVLVDPVVDVTQAIAIAEQLQACFQAPLSVGSRNFFITASIGIVLSAVGGDCPETFLRNADIALHAAKNTGKASYKVFDAKMHASAVERLQIETDLHHAVKQQSLRVHYQPIVDVKTLEIRGFEALVRWYSPDQGCIMPINFIPIAEESGLILEMGWWVMETACRQMQIWQQQFTHCQTMTMSINFSSKQFFAANCLEQIERILAVTGIAPQQIKLEITESLVMHLNDATESKLRWLRDLGMQLSVDDFGTGYSSLSYLYRFPLTELKIDQAFIQNVPDHAQKPAIVEAIIWLGQKLGLAITAEGVETIAQLEWLQRNGVEQVQGFLFAEPLTAEVLTILLAERATLLPQTTGS